MTPEERHRRLTRIFILASDRDADDRRKVLERYCRDRSELRREAEQLLFVHDSISRRNKVRTVWGI